MHLAVKYALYAALEKAVQTDAHRLVRLLHAALPEDKTITDVSKKRRVGAIKRVVLSTTEALVDALLSGATTNAVRARAAAVLAACR